MPAGWRGILGALMVMRTGHGMHRRLRGVGRGGRVVMRWDRSRPGTTASGTAMPHPVSAIAAAWAGAPAIAAAESTIRIRATKRMRQTWSGFARDARGQGRLRDGQAVAREGRRTGKTDCGDRRG